MQLETLTPLLLFFVLPIIAYVYWISIKEFKRFGRSKTYGQYAAHSCLPSYNARHFSISIAFLAFSSIIVGICNPYTVYPSNDTVYKNVRLFFLLDVSRSMVLAEDIKPNRLVAAKEEISHAISSLDGVYPTCLIPFAGNANMQYCPLTYNKASFLSLLKDADDQLIGQQGSNFESLFSSLDKYVERNEIKDGVNIVVLLSDGGKEEGVSLNKEAIAKNIQRLSSVGFKFYTIGIGSGASPLVVRNSDGSFNHYLTVDNRLIKSSLDDNTLKYIAEVGNGSYIPYTKNGDLSPHIKDIILSNRVFDKLDKNIKTYSLRHFFFAASVILLMLSLHGNIDYFFLKTN